MLALKGVVKSRSQLTNIFEFLLCATPSVRNFIDRALFNHNKNYRTISTIAMAFIFTVVSETQMRRNETFQIFLIFNSVCKSLFLLLEVDVI